MSSQFVLELADLWISATSLSFFLQTQGAFAEYAVVNTKALARLPESVSFEDASGLPVAAMTALQGLIKGGLTFPKGTGRVLVQAASGGVGHYAVQVGLGSFFGRIVG